MRTRLLAGAALIVAAGCGGGGGGTNSAAPYGPGTGSTTLPVETAPNAVLVTNDAFTPATINTTAGSTVTWTWNSCSGGDIYGDGQTCVSHGIVFNDGIGNSPTQSSGTASRTFTAAGSYPYHCIIHGTAMSGTVVVQ